MAGTADAGGTAAFDAAFVALAGSWMENPARRFLRFIWQAYDDMRACRPHVDPRDLERSITQLLEPRVRDRMSGDEPFYIQHGPFERETMRPPPAQPPEYDLAFVFRADERIMWPIEAKVLETARGVAAYVRDIKNEFLTCRYAPFSSSAAMVGYLLSGSAEDVFASVAGRLRCTLDPVSEHPTRRNRLSQHRRNVPADKPYPVAFVCYHLIFEYPDLGRAP